MNHSGHKTVTLVRREPAALGSWVKHWATALPPLGSKELNGFDKLEDYGVTMSLCFIGAAIGPLLTGVLWKYGTNAVFWMLIGADLAALVVSIKWWYSKAWFKVYT